MSYGGLEVSLPLAEYGLNGSKNVDAIPPGALIDTLNLDLWQGLVGREGGSAKYNATALAGAPKIKALLDWWPTPAQQRLMTVSTDGKVSRFTSGALDATMKTGLAAGMVPVWAQAGRESFGNSRKALLTTGLDVVQVVVADAAVTRDINATKPADWATTVQPRSLFLHRLRLWGVLQFRAYFSTTTDHEDFQAFGSGQLPIFPGSYDYLQGGVSFKETLFLFGWPLGIFIVDDTSPNFQTWGAQRLTTGIGLASPTGLCLVDDDVLFVSEVGHLHLLSHVREGDIQASDLTVANDLVPWITDHLDLDAASLQFATAAYYPAKRLALVTLRGQGSVVNNLKLYVDFNRPGRPRVHVSDKDVAESLAMQRDAKSIQRPITGDDAGTVWVLDQAARAKAGAAYASRFQTAHTDFAWVDPKLGARRKNFKILEATFLPTGNYSLSVDSVVDGQYRETVLFSLGSTGAVLGAFVLGTDSLATEFVQSLRRRLHGSGYYLSLIGRLAGAGQDFNVSSLTVAFTPGSQRP